MVILAFADNWGYLTGIRIIKAKAGDTEAAMTDSALTALLSDTGIILHANAG